MTNRTRTDRGAATVFAAAIAMILALAATAALLVSAVVVASHRARSAADLAALAGAAAEAVGDDPCSASRVNAQANGGQVLTCRLSGDATSFVVAVSVSVSTGLSSPLPTIASASAHAGNVAK